MTKNLDLAGAHARVERALKHIVEFEAARLQFNDEHRYQDAKGFVVAERDDKTGATIHKVGKLPTIPAALPIIAGDAVHNLRVALDYVASEIAKTVNYHKARDIYFPISENLEKFEDNLKRNAGWMPDIYRTKIRSFRPYGGGDDLLWWLHQLDIIDKHRLLVTVVLRNGGISFNPPNGGTLIIKNLNANELLACGDILMESTGRSDVIHFETDIAFDVANPLRQTTVTATLHKMQHRVLEILASFE